MSDDIAALLQLVEQQVASVNTTMPGVVVAYDSASNRATVRPLLPKRLANGEELPPPLIYNVPVHWSSSAGGQASFTFPVHAGDPVMLHFAQRSTEGFLSGNHDAPDDPRMHDLSDAIAVPGLQVSGLPGDAENVQLKFGAAYITIRPDGSLSLGNSACSITFGADGNISVSSPMFASNGEIKAKDIALSVHKHRDVQPGTATSGVPIP